MPVKSRTYLRGSPLHWSSRPCRSGSPTGSLRAKRSPSRLLPTLSCSTCESASVRTRRSQAPPLRARLTPPLGSFGGFGRRAQDFGEELAGVALRDGHHILRRARGHHGYTAGPSFRAHVAVPVRGSVYAHVGH